MKNFTQYDSTVRYDADAAPGVLPTGTQVKFSDGTTGNIVQGYTNGKSLVSFPTGGGETSRDTYSNDILKV